MKIFLCGTRAVIQRSEKDYRVVCASCEAGGSVKHINRDAAKKACVRDSNKPCRSCGAS